jgi:hypothetical protein
VLIEVKYSALRRVALLCLCSLLHGRKVGDNRAIKGRKSVDIAAATWHAQADLSR